MARLSRRTGSFEYLSSQGAGACTNRQAASVPNSSILLATEVGGNRPWKRRNGRTCWLTKVPDFVSVNLQFVVNNMSTCSLLAGFYLREVLGTVCCIVVE